jgi:hypothetical protein
MGLVYKMDIIRKFRNNNKINNLKPLNITMSMNLNHNLGKSLP